MGCLFWLPDQLKRPLACFFSYWTRQLAPLASLFGYQNSPKGLWVFFFSYGPAQKSLAVFFFRTSPKDLLLSGIQNCQPGVIGASLVPKNASQGLLEPVRYLKCLLEAFGASLVPKMQATDFLC